MRRSIARIKFASPIGASSAAQGLDRYTDQALFQTANSDLSQAQIAKEVSLSQFERDTDLKLQTNTAWVRGSSFTRKSCFDFEGGVPSRPVL